MRSIDQERMYRRRLAEHPSCNRWICSNHQTCGLREPRDSNGFLYEFLTGNTYNGEYLHGSTRRIPTSGNTYTAYSYRESHATAITYHGKYLHIKTQLTLTVSPLPRSANSIWVLWPPFLASRAIPNPPSSGSPHIVSRGATQDAFRIFVFESGSWNDGRLDVNVHI